MNLQSIVNGSGLYWILYFVTENIYIYIDFFFGVEKKKRKLESSFYRFGGMAEW